MIIVQRNDYTFPSVWWDRADQDQWGLIAVCLFNYFASLCTISRPAIVATTLVVPLFPPCGVIGFAHSVMRVLAAAPWTEDHLWLKNLIT